MSLKHLYTAMKCTTLYHSLNEFDSQSAAAAQHVWHKYFGKQRIYGQLSQNTQIIIDEKQAARAHEKTHTLGAYISDAGKNQLPNTKAFARDILRAPFTNFCERYVVPAAPLDERDEDEEERAVRVRFAAETHCDHLRKYKDLRTDYPQLTAAEYETIAGEICFRGRIIHADIATEAGLKLEHNSPLHDDRHRAQCSRNDALTLEAWTDGSADAQAQNVGYAVYWGENHLLNYSRRMPHDVNTNNTAELSAVLHALSVIENIVI
jgi:hypothetical protein